MFVNLGQEGGTGLVRHRAATKSLTSHLKADCHILSCCPSATNLPCRPLKSWGWHLASHSLKSLAKGISTWIQSIRGETIEGVSSCSLSELCGCPLALGR